MEEVTVFCHISDLTPGLTEDHSMIGSAVTRVDGHNFITVSTFSGSLFSPQGFSLSLADSP